MTDSGSSGLEETARQLRAIKDVVRRELGDEPELVAACVKAYLEYQNQRLGYEFEARKEYARQVWERDRLAQTGIREYSIQTLKWSFLMNAGAIGVVVAYAGTMSTKAVQPVDPAQIKSIFAALWPFGIGLFLTFVAGTLGYINFSAYAETHPSAEVLANNMMVPESRYPLGRMRRGDEDPSAYFRRSSRWLTYTSAAGFLCGVGSGLMFLLGMFLVFRALL